MSLIEIAKSFMMEALESIENSHLRSAAYEVYYDPRFHEAPGSHTRHHAYRSGLLIHTAEVVTVARRAASAFREADMDVLTTAAIFHDFNKIFEYAIDDAGVIEKTKYRNLVRHVAGSHAKFVAAMANISADQVCPGRIMKIEHAILAHHGRLEWGSPIEPQTIEAHTLHFADMMSFQFGAKTLDSVSSLL